MKSHRLNRRQFLERAAVAAGAVALLPNSLLGAASAKRTAADQVPLGKSGVKTSRLIMGTGSNNGHVQTALGREGFNKLVRYAYDQGVTGIDCAAAYATFGWIADATRGLPREKLFLQSKVDGRPEDALAAIDRHRKVFNTDYVDSLLVHCMYKGDWTDNWKRIMDAFNEAQEKQWIRAKGVSCHSLPALRAAVASSWSEVHLVRVNPQGRHVDGPAQSVWSNQDEDVNPVVAELKTMRAKGRGVIGMKIIGNGEFVDAEDREKSIRFAMARPEIDAVVIGFKSPAEIDETIQRMNRALAEAA